MRISVLYPVLGAALLIFAQPALAQNASVMISSPSDGAQLSSMAEHKVLYEVMPGATGDHSHLYVDNKEVAVLRQLKGSHTLTGLTAGQHTICIKVVNKGHTPIGVEQCVKVNVS